MDTSDIQVEVAPVEDLARGELGLIAKAHLEPGDILAWAELSLLLDKGKAVDVWGSLVEGLSDRVAVALLLIHERFVKGESSTWQTYIRSLPGFDGDVSGPSFLWSEEELQLLEGSDCAGASAGMYNTIVEEYDYLNETLLSLQPSLFPPEVFSFENMLWASAQVASRAYGDNSEGAHLCIAPLVDFLNHKAGALQLTRFGNGIVAYAHKHYEPGEQVWVSYGGKSNAELLSQYGFVDVDNGQEAVYLRLGSHLQLTGPQEQRKLELLEDLLGEGVDASAAIFKLTRRPRDWQAHLLPAVRILALCDEDTWPANARDMAPKQSDRLEAAAYAVLEEAIARRASEYPSSLKEDRAALAQGSLPERHTLALQLRVSEQELLELTQSHAAEQRALIQG